MKIICLLPFILFLSSCQTARYNAGSEFQLRPYQEEVLDNGLRIIFIQDVTLPLVQMSMLMKVGSLNEQAGEEGINFMTANLLEQGTNKKSAPVLADQLGQIAAEFRATPGHDYTFLDISSIAAEKMTMLDLFSEIVMNPSFQSAEIERLRAQQLALLQKSQDNPSGYADQLNDRELFRGHPYSHPVYGLKKSVGLFTRTDILRNYLKYYRPNNAFLAVTGKIDEEFKQAVKKSFSNWQKRQLEAPADKSMKLAEKGILKLFSKPGLQQSQIRLSQIGIKRSDADYLKLRLAFMVLGGSFSSRLNQRVRDDLGLTYSIHSSVDAKKENGALEINTFTRNDKLFETISETQKVMQEFAVKGVSPQELDSAKALMSGQFPSAIETTAKLAYNLMVLRFHGVSDDYLKNYNANLKKISHEDVNEVIRRHFYPDKFQIIVYADQEKTAEQLRKFGEFQLEKVQ